MNGFAKLQQQGGVRVSGGPMMVIHDEEPVGAAGRNNRYNIDHLSLYINNNTLFFCSSFLFLHKFLAFTYFSLPNVCVFIVLWFDHRIYLYIYVCVRVFFL